ncbi:MAG TPA: hypothetical protein VFR24_27835 [Candidatus Angelobacter sp.]|nr:hypothetical protein [Candidatus Angelobacter sp.]
MARRKNLRVRLSKESVLTIDRSRMWKKRLAYILVANKAFKYPYGNKTHILYIGTTRKGAQRPAASAVEKAMSLFGEVRGVKQIGIYLLNSESRRNVKTWQKLESALLAVFRQRYSSLPQENKRRGEYGNADDIQYFRRDNLEKILRIFERPPKL